MEPINVLSLFDGISCGRVALERAGIPVGWYGASEVDRSAIAVALHNYPDTHTLGDVRMVSGDYLPRVDLLIGGSPCQGFSYAGKKLNFDDPRSRLFFEYVRLLEETKPRWFLLENVRMNKTSRDVISSYLGVEPVEIDSALVSAQHRKRLYWTNLPIRDIQDKGLTVLDIYSPDNYSPNHTVAASRLRRVLNSDIEKGHVSIQADGSYKFLNTTIKISGESVYCDSVLAMHTPSKRYYGRGSQFSKTGKAFTVTATDRNGIFYGSVYRVFTITELERLQTLPDGYVQSATSYSAALRAIGNGWTVDVIAHILSEIKEAV